MAMFLREIPPTEPLVDIRLSEKEAKLLLLLTDFLTDYEGGHLISKTGTKHVVNKEGRQLLSDIAASLTDFTYYNTYADYLV